MVADRWKTESSGEGGDRVEVRIHNECYPLCLHPFQIEEGHVAAVVARPESTKSIELNGAKHELLFASLAVSPHIRGLLVHALADDPNSRTVVAAYWVPLAPTLDSDPLVLMQQLARRFGFPVRVGEIVSHFISQEQVLISERAEDLTEVVGVLAPNGASWMSFPILKQCQTEDGSAFLDVRMVYALNTESYRAWIDRVFETDPVAYYVNPSLTSVSPADLVAEESTLVSLVQPPWEDLSRQLLFGIEAFGYYLVAGFEAGLAFIERNGYRASARYIDGQPTNGSPVIAFFIWSRDTLKIALSEGEGHEVQTPPAAPPNRLQEWLDRRALSPRRRYDSEEEVFSEALLLVQRLQEQISALALQSQFWHSQASGHVPKREEELQSLIHALLSDRAKMKQLEVVPERIAGSGRLDFSIGGILASGERATVCLECKLGQSGKLVHGLTKQLPEYMRSLHSDSGIYCVVFFGSEYAPSRTLSTPGGMLSRLEHARVVREVSKIRCLVLDVSPAGAPSH